ncbi:MAG: sugar-specific transcriptional regulator TrmB [Haloquadratum walsbyi J07HQW1]|jgi:predicted transcriptional regulator|uniref:Sugar-specific transcriptional regulator TrmB n=1 Tax=Haloquadratum walsbyi J07HQW1 TaxID=1238424 RepID=U1PHC9_9EURY|nr:MAG: sugar-specific transcriptional regulator TrmB [Haloquadratum walsbyi J07HQW1]
MTMQRAFDSESTTSLETPSVPSELTSPRAKLVYLFLSANGETTLSELQSALNMQKLSLYSILSTLRERELIDQQAERYIVDN